MREIKVYVGAGLDEQSIKHALNRSGKDGEENRLLFGVAHALLNEHEDDRAEIHEVIVEEVTVDPIFPSQVQIEFTTSWSLYYGCRDMNMADDENQTEFATYTADGHLIFVVPLPRRPANHC